MKRAARGSSGNDEESRVSTRLEETGGVCSAGYRQRDRRLAVALCLPFILCAEMKRVEEVRSDEQAPAHACLLLSSFSINSTGLESLR